MPTSLVVHGHFYQPPRENPWLDDVEREPSAAPAHDWNARIHAECYRANAYARIYERAGRIQTIVNNYGRMSFNFGPTLARWIERHDGRAHARLVAADVEQRRRLGAGGAVAQAYAHPIVPLATPQDRRTQVLWGLSDFRRRFGRAAEGFWLPETAASGPTLETLIDLGVRYTILAPEQVAAVREPGVDEWTSVDRDSVDTGRAYRWLHRDGSGRYLTVAVFDGPLSRGVAFGDATRDAATFIAMTRASATRSRAADPLVLCASDGELFGHHKKFADLNLAFTTYVEGPRAGVEPTNLGAYLQSHPATWEMMLAEGPDGKGTAWSCAHGVGRWWQDCGCSMVPPERGWNHRWRTPMRAAFDRLQDAAAHFYEESGSTLLLDPWGARDAYGEVVDAPLEVRDALLSDFGRSALRAGRSSPSTDGRGARDQARLLLEMQRATLLMFASCGWYFDDIAGLEAGLVLRFAAHAADLMKQAGGEPPVTEMLDILAEAHSNEAVGETGADVFRRVGGDRITHGRALATVALASLRAPSPTDVVCPSGWKVETPTRSRQEDYGRLRVWGKARVTNERTGIVEEQSYDARWDAGRGFRCTIGDEEVAVEELGRASRQILLPLLLPCLEAERDARLAGRLALAIGKDAVGAGDSPEDAVARSAYARLFIRLISADKAVTNDVVDGALALLDAAGAALAPGAPDRSTAEEIVAELLKADPHRAALGRLALKLGFAWTAPDDVASAPVEPVPSLERDEPFASAPEPQPQQPQPPQPIDMIGLDEPT